jgi:putative membrane protein
MAPVKPQIGSFGRWLGVLVRGMCMGAADLVPGFSGGTVAFITGIYPDLVGSVVSFNSDALRLLFKGQLRAFFNVVGWEFLLTLLLGILCSMAAFAGLIHSILGDPVARSYLYAAFVGLVLASTLFCIRQVRVWGSSRYLGFVAGCLVALATVLGDGTSASDRGDQYDITLPLERLPPSDNLAAVVNYDVQSQRILRVPGAIAASMIAKELVAPTDLAYSHRLDKEAPLAELVVPAVHFRIDIWLIFCGFIAIIALLLPGISGSYILVILGAYPIVIGATSDIVAGFTHLTFDTDAFFTLLSVVMGILVGLVTFSRVISWLLHHYRDVTVATMIGFMVGALPSIWPFWHYVYALSPLRLKDGPQLELIHMVLPDVTQTTFWFAMGWATIGFIAVYLLEVACQKQEAQKSS